MSNNRHPDLDPPSGLLSPEQALAQQSGTELPRWRCHKEVRALKIKAITQPREHAVTMSDAKLITPEEEGCAPFMVDSAYVLRHRPQVGGYYVVYEDGYTSYSPAKAFEEGYTKI